MKLGGQIGFIVVILGITALAVGQMSSGTGNSQMLAAIGIGENFFQVGKVAILPLGLILFWRKFIA